MFGLKSKRAKEEPNSNKKTKFWGWISVGIISLGIVYFQFFDKIILDQFIKSFGGLWSFIILVLGVMVALELITFIINIFGKDKNHKNQTIKDFDEHLTTSENNLQFMLNVGICLLLYQAFKDQGFSIIFLLIIAFLSLIKIYFSFRNFGLIKISKLRLEEISHEAL